VYVTVQSNTQFIALHVHGHVLLQRVVIVEGTVIHTGAVCVVIISIKQMISL
jgi:hypothetical protein